MAPGQRRRSPGLDEFFLSGDGIEREVLQRRLARYLGAEARSRPDTYNGVRGFMIKAIRPFTSEQLNDLKEESTEYTPGSRRDLAPLNRYGQNPLPDADDYYSTRSYQPAPPFNSQSNDRATTYPTGGSGLYQQGLYRNSDPYEGARTQIGTRNAPSSMYPPEDAYNGRGYAGSTGISSFPPIGTTYLPGASGYGTANPDPYNLSSPISRQYVSSNTPYGAPGQDPYGGSNAAQYGPYANQGWQANQGPYESQGQPPQEHSSPQSDYHRSQRYDLYDCPSRDCNRVKGHGFGSKDDLMEHLRKKHSKSPRSGSMKH